MNIWILIIIVAGGWGSNSGAGVTSVEFTDRYQCERAQDQVLKNKQVTRIEAFCVEK